ncbi:hypothetical protein [Sporichthya polymorpha]|uniref:hypothetical protein n=1 Tax=Sporichthya polymorpha TaxID=35751 RepID=UPI00036AF664|nr:hypothetical protein [Sporichthya polymorpha]
MELFRYLRLQWDRAVAVGAVVLAAVVLLLGYLGTARTEYIAGQIPYLISGGLVGLMLLTVAAVLWISADLRDEWRVMHRQNELLHREQVEQRSALVDLVREELAARGVPERT